MKPTKKLKITPFAKDVGAALRRAVRKVYRQAAKANASVVVFEQGRIRSIKPGRSKKSA